VPRFAEVDATRPIDAVVADVAAHILEVAGSNGRRAGSAR
jgi:hypothetical protein